MHKDQSRIAAIELNDQACWEIHFKPYAVLSVEDIVCIYQYLHQEPVRHPVLMDWHALQGIEFEALEYIARTQGPGEPLAIIADPGSIGEKYGHLINQLCESNCTCLVFKTAQEALSWMDRSERKEA